MEPQAPTASRCLAWWWVGVLLGAGIAFLLASASPPSAQADPYTPPAGVATEPDLPASGRCPAGGYGSYSGSDDAAAELRNLREEIAGVCDALADRQDEVAHRLWWVVAEQLEAAGRTATSNDFLRDIKAALAPPVAVSIDSPRPLPVTDSSGEQYSDDVAAAVDASGAATKEALWYLVGTLVAVFFAYTLWRTVSPRA